MKRVIKNITEDGKILQLTVADERFYIRYDENEQPTYYPSVTWIAGHYPKGVGFYRWLASKGWDEAEAIKTAAGDKGSKVHQAINDLIDGKIIVMDSQYLNNTTEQMEELTLEEYEYIMSFVQWFEENKPLTIAKDLTVFNEEQFYAGTLDYICQIGEQLWLIDFKTSQNIWPEHELQISAYKHAALPVNFVPDKAQLKIAILQIGYQRNKNKFKFTEIEDKFNLFLATKQIWQEESGKQQPLRKDLPVFLQLSQNLIK
jgi:hypothetical protein